MHQSFVTTAPNLWGWAGNSKANVRGSHLLSYPIVLGPMEFTSIIKKSSLYDPQQVPAECRAFSRAFSRAVMDEKSLSPQLFPVGGGGGGSGYK